MCMASTTVAFTVAAPDKVDTHADCAHPFASTQTDLQVPNSLPFSQLKDAFNQNM